MTSESNVALRHYYLYLDLKDDAELITQYEAYHQPGQVWPEIIDSIKAAGVEDMVILRSLTHLVMQMTVNDRFSFENKQNLDRKNSIVQQWEALMEKFQASTGTNKWQLMVPIFHLQQH